ncbi:metastasis-associated protein MTA3 isoform X8 [Scyliorhinus canicula]|uniref:metastasis-associated protein MTA3 isoform X8 n=1 Tax=Scyliorhinus canicula TaxID=7830 RepID=UPI0018F4E177|nr:metastasis-associated protein MTA3 isoform X8 [Scyliorhinus canicula]
MEEELETPSILDLTEKQRHQLKHREIFLSRQYESLPATHIRGKCGVSLLNETESVACYLEKEDGFFYSLVYDPSQKTLLADKGEIRVGSRYQADISDMLNEGEADARDQTKMEVKVWDPDNPLNDRQIDQFLVVARAVGTFARALDCSSSVRQPSLHMSAAAASRDITLLPWKSLTSIIEYYYMWKTTERYVQQKRLKAAEAESKLKQVYIPTYNKPNPNQISNINGKPAVVNGPIGGLVYQPQNSGIGRPCESCYITQSQQWYSWGPPNMQCRLCASCWTYWKKYGGLKMPTRTEAEKMSPTHDISEPHIRGAFRHGQPGHGVPIHIDSPKSTLKTRQSFFLQTTHLTKLARHVCRDILRLKQAARRPFVPINCAAIKAECTMRFPEAMKRPLSIKAPLRKPLTSVIKYLEVHPAVKPKVLRRVPSLVSGNSSQSPKRLFTIQNHGSPTILGKQIYSQHNGVDGSVRKRLLMSYRDVVSHVQGPLMSTGHFSYLANGKGISTGINAIQPGTVPIIQRQRPNWIDAPDDGFFMATEETRWMPNSSFPTVRKKIRKLLSPSEMRRASRRPCLPVVTPPLQPSFTPSDQYK